MSTREKKGKGKLRSSYWGKTSVYFYGRKKKTGHAGKTGVPFVWEKSSNVRLLGERGTRIFFSLNMGSREYIEAQKGGEGMSAFSREKLGAIFRSAGEQRGTG